MTKRANPPRVYRAQKVVATLQRDTRPSLAKGSVLVSPSSVVDGMADYLSDRATEVFVVIFIDVRNRVVGYSEMAEGNIAGVTVNTAGIFREALVSGAAGILTVHNHPTGVAEPSAEDRALWQRLRAVGDLLGVPVIDNMVMGDTSYYSESEEGGGPITRRKEKEPPP